jgi:predicted nucleic acid-binding protein
MRLVVDASAVVPFVAHEEDPAVVPFFSAEHELHAPAICDAEVVGGLAKHVRVGSLSDSEARDALIDYVSMPLTRHMHLGLIARTFELSANFAAADASYVGLAEALDAGLLTLDRSLGRAVTRHTALAVFP